MGVVVACWRGFINSLLVEIASDGTLIVNCIANKISTLSAFIGVGWAVIESPVFKWLYGIAGIAEVGSFVNYLLDRRKHLVYPRLVFPHLRVVEFHQVTKCQNPCAVLSLPVHNKCGPVWIEGPKRKNQKNESKSIKKRKIIANRKRSKRRKNRRSRNDVHIYTGRSTFSLWWGWGSLHNLNHHLIV
jgi:hypothetical protein